MPCRPDHPQRPSTSPGIATSLRFHRRGARPSSSAMAVPPPEDPTGSIHHQEPRGCTSASATLGPSRVRRASTRTTADRSTWPFASVSADGYLRSVSRSIPTSTARSAPSSSQSIKLLDRAKHRAKLIGRWGALQPTRGCVQAAPKPEGRSFLGKRITSINEDRRRASQPQALCVLGARHFLKDGLHIPHALFKERHANPVVQGLQVRAPIEVEQPYLSHAQALGSGRAAAPAPDKGLGARGSRTYASGGRSR